MAMATDHLNEELNQETGKAISLCSSVVPESSCEGMDVDNCIEAVNVEGGSAVDNEVLFQTTGRYSRSYLHLAALEIDGLSAARLIRVARDPRWLDVIDKYRQTPLHLASFSNNYVAVRRLIIAGAKSDILDVQGNTPLHIACAKGHFDSVMALVEEISAEELQACRHEYAVSGENSTIRTVNNFNYDGLTPVHLAVINGHEEIVDYFSAMGIAMDTPDLCRGLTALHLAASKGLVNIVKVLIQESGVNPATPSFAGVQPLQCARDHREWGTVATLLFLGAPLGKDVESSLLHLKENGQ